MLYVFSGYISYDYICICVFVCMCLVFACVCMVWLYMYMCVCVCILNYKWNPLYPVEFKYIFSIYSSFYIIPMLTKNRNL